MCTYLAKRGSTYYFRRAVPLELRVAMEGRAEFMLSLGTKDRDEAKRRIPAQTLRTDALLADAAAKLAAAPPETATENRERVLGSRHVPPPPMSRNPGRRWHRPMPREAPSRALACGRSLTG